MITVETKYLGSGEASLPALAMQITSLVDSYMLWIGITDASPEDVSHAPLQGCLARDWACAMPPFAVCSPLSDDSLTSPDIQPGVSAPATSLFRSSSSDVSLAMAQRLGE